MSDLLTCEQKRIHGRVEEGTIPTRYNAEIGQFGYVHFKIFSLKKLGLHLVMGDVGWRRMEVNPMRKLASNLPGKLGKYLY